MRDPLLKQDKIRENKLMIAVVTDLKIPCISDVSRLKQSNNRRGQTKPLQGAMFKISK